MKILSAEALCEVFNDCFQQSEHTLLVGGAEEPFYVPQRGAEPARVFFRADYVSSALHEVAHWCVAGARRRLLQDYGYWYAPDGRNPQQQRAFFAVEARPQALEAIFSAAAGVRFRPSIDNLLGGYAAQEEQRFKSRIDAYRAQYEQHMPARAARFEAALRCFCAH